MVSLIKSDWCFQTLVDHHAVKKYYVSYTILYYKILFSSMRLYLNINYTNQL